MTEFYEKLPEGVPPEKLTVIYWDDTLPTFQHVVEKPLSELPPDIKKENIVGYYF